MPSGRLHGRYIRHVADLPLMGCIVSLSLQIRRFRCSQPDCPRHIFAERLPAAPFRKRRTVRLAEVQRSLALGTGGELGSRLASLLAMPVSGDTLLRLIRAVPVQPAPPARIIGIDDWAWRRGRRYGTLIVDLERANRPIDLLPDRDAETVAAWLKSHPGVEIVARDRAGAFADGVRIGAPQAIQVADRFHLLCNLGDAVGNALNRHHRDIRAAAKAATAAQPPAPVTVEPVDLPASTSKPPTKRQQHSLDKQAARQVRFDEVVALHVKGWSKSRIARTLGLDRGTVHVWLKTGRLPSWQQPPGDSAVDVHGDYLRRRWDEGCHNGVRLWREIRERGFAGGASTVRDWIRRLRAANPQPAGSLSAWKTPSSRRAAWLVVADPDEIDATERRFVDALIAGSAELAHFIALAREFRMMIREQQEDRLDDWLLAAEKTAFAGFAGGLRRDLAAVRAALSLSWSTGPVEGRICHLKTIKRTMCGRAGFDLLRHRVLEAA
jgi:transposase